MDVEPRLVLDHIAMVFERGGPHPAANCGPPDRESGGQEFESLPARQISDIRNKAANAGMCRSSTLTSFFVISPAVTVDVAIRDGNPICGWQRQADSLS